MRRHHRIHSMRDRRFERFHFHGADSIGIGCQGRQVGVTIQIRIAVPREMLRRQKHHVLRIGMRALHECGNVGRHIVRILAVGTDIDHRVCGIVIDVGIRREDPLNSQGPRLARRHQARIARLLQVARRPISHRERKFRGVAHAHGRATLEVARH